MSTRGQDGSGTGGPEPASLVLDVEVAEELVALVRDEPGDADEELLDEVLDSIEAAAPHVPGPDQRRAATGRAVVIEIRDAGASALRTLIRQDKAVDQERLRRIGERLTGKLRRARAKRR